MKKLLLLSAALVAILASPAMAQRDNGGRGEGPRATQGQQDRGARGDSRIRPAPPTAASELPQRQMQQPQRAQQPQRGQQAQREAQRDSRPDFRRDNDRRDFDRSDNRRWDNDNRRWDNNRPGFNNRPGYDNRRYSNYYRNWNSASRYRAGAYYRPSGYYYRRWTYGDVLPSLFWGNRYWLNNYYAYDLPPPPVGTIWVRYGDDALLIDRYTGEVIQVSYSVFW